MLSREQRVLRKNLKETLKTKNILIEMKTDFDGFTNGLDTAQKKILELQIMSMETFKTKSKRERCLKNEQNIQELCICCIDGFFYHWATWEFQEWWNNSKRCNIHVMEISEVEERNRRNIWSNNDWNFLKFTLDRKLR